MTKVEMTALDSFHASAAIPADLVAGGKFTINADEAAELEKSGLAKPNKSTAAVRSAILPTSPVKQPAVRKSSPAKSRKS